MNPPPPMARRDPAEILKLVTRLKKSGLNDIAKAFQDKADQIAKEKTAKP